MERVLVLATEWQFDAFQLAGAACGRPLAALGFYVLKTSGLVARLGLPASALAR